MLAQKTKVENGKDNKKTSAKLQTAVDWLSTAWSSQYVIINNSTQQICH